jgi:hypothetical protein
LNARRDRRFSRGVAREYSASLNDGLLGRQRLVLPDVALAGHLRWVGVRAQQRWRFRRDVFEQPLYGLVTSCSLQPNERVQLHTRARVRRPHSV